MTAAAFGPLLLATMWASLWSPAEAQCTPELRRKRPTHTLCKPPNPACTIYEAGVDAAQRALIVNRHNEHRSEVAQGRLRGFPAAADMQELLWDDEIAQVAQAHASLCTPPTGDILQHDKHEDRFTSQFQTTGQNLAWDGQSYPVNGPNWTFAIDEWYVEYKHYPAQYVRQFPGAGRTAMPTGHFTQVIWAKTRYIGCGYVYYTVPGAQFPYMRKYTCNYGPSGNYRRRSVYQEGATCSACPPPTRCSQATGLCDGQGPSVKGVQPKPGHKTSPPNSPEMTPTSEPAADTPSWPYVTLGVTLAVVLALLRASFSRNETRKVVIVRLAGGADPYKCADKLDVEALFINPKVQNLLQKLTGFDIDKIFAPVPVPLNTPRYKFLTDEQLEQELQDSRRRARQKLQMPPVLRERKPCEKVLAKDPEIQGFNSSPYIFTDISFGYKDRERLVVVREPSGELRTAKWEERERMLQTYFTNKDKSFYMPKMFEPGHLQDVLDKQWYRFVLDRACIQFEPDDADYIRVTHAAYDHIDAKRGFHELRSTRHFGPMAFYLAVVGKVDNLLIDLLQREM
ncbi:hypothetical protein HPB50_005313 [Hyalomma asiaticum]|uniref:Uncharacterized protein n=1 Tax=Hyalomma asiaticum TaxID=266040 RepID=A0ACB7SBR2_HYAAI|nr:hypothetical protein HPB50_005313 [Hyalomma asiaticum]